MGWRGCFSSLGHVWVPVIAWRVCKGLFGGLDEHKPGVWLAGVLLPRSGGSSTLMVARSLLGTPPRKRPQKPKPLYWKNILKPKPRCWEDIQTYLNTDGTIPPSLRLCCIPDIHTRRSSASIRTTNRGEGPPHVRARVPRQWARMGWTLLMHGARPRPARRARFGVRRLRVILPRESCYRWR